MGMGCFVKRTDFLNLLVPEVQGDKHFYKWRMRNNSKMQKSQVQLKCKNHLTYVSIIHFHCFHGLNNNVEGKGELFK